MCVCIYVCGHIYVYRDRHILLHVRQGRLLDSCQALLVESPRGNRTSMFSGYEISETPRGLLQGPHCIFGSEWCHGGF